MQNTTEIIKNRINELTDKYEGYVIDCRHKLHKGAEISGKEIKTSAFIRTEAEKLGLTVEKASATGLVVTLDTGRPGNNVALRADIDALPMHENACNLKEPRAFVSDDPEAAHTCGHDGHMAMLLGAMQVLNEMKELLSGKVYFCFEEGEEVSDGYKGILNVLSYKQVDTVFALHVLSTLEHGTLNIVEGVRTSGIIGLKATFIGKGGHGSRPDLAANPVFCAANAICNLSVAMKNQTDARETVTLGITDIIGSHVFNVIPDRATVLGSLRFFNAEEGRKTLKLIQDVFDHTAAYSKCTVEYGDSGIMAVPAVNDKDAVAVAREAFRLYAPEIPLADCEKWFASECYAAYLQKYKGALGYLGIRNEEKGCGANHHNEYFDLDESALKNGMLSHVAFTAYALQNDKVKEFNNI